MMIVKPEKTQKLLEKLKKEGKVYGLCFDFDNHLHIDDGEIELSTPLYLVIVNDQVWAETRTLSGQSQQWGFSAKEGEPKPQQLLILAGHQKVLVKNGDNAFYINCKKDVSPEERLLCFAAIETSVYILAAHGGFGNAVYSRIFSPDEVPVAFQIMAQLTCSYGNAPEIQEILKAFGCTRASMESQGEADEKF